MGRPFTYSMVSKGAYGAYFLRHVPFFLSPFEFWG